MRNTLPVALIVMGFIVGCGDGDESLSRKAGKGIGDGISDFVSGAAESVDEKLAVELSSSDERAELGFEATTSKLVVEGVEKVVSVYLISSKEFSGVLTAKAFNKEGQEIGRSRVEVQFGPDDAKYVNFKFPGEMDRASVEKYEIGVGK